MTLRLLLWLLLTAALFWVITPALLMPPDTPLLVVRAVNGPALAWFCITVGATILAALITGYGGRRRLAMSAALLIVLWLLPLCASQYRALVILQAQNELGLLWLLLTTIGTLLLLLLAGKRIRAHDDERRQMGRLLALVDEKLNEGVALYDRRMKLRWANESARSYLLDGEKPHPDVARLMQRALDTRRVSSQSLVISETVRVNVQASPLEDGFVSLIAFPLQNEAGPILFYEQFIRRIVHDMRNPLAAIIAHATNLQNTPAQDGLTAATIEHEAQRLTRLVDSMLFDARLSYVPLALEPVDLLDVVEDVYFQHDERAIREGKTIHIETLPDAATVEADRDLLVRALSNLIDNSLKYSPSGGSVRITLEATVDSYLIKVADTGDGIPPDYLPDRIFEPLVRVRPREGGSGLGLSIVKKIVELHHGDISVSSTLGKGTMFTLCLPKQHFSF